MKKIADLVGFRRDLFFDGAVQIGWFETDPERRDQAAANFVFHGPQYHGVSDDDLRDAGGFPLIDTVRFTQHLLNALDPQQGTSFPFALAIAGWGTGKSHLGLTLATLLSHPQTDIAEAILANLEAADASLGKTIRTLLRSRTQPVLVLPINGMRDFDLASELSRQVLVQLRSHGLDTSPIEDLWPRFQVAATFVERNFDLRRDEFAKRFGELSSLEHLLRRLEEHDDFAYQQVNDIFEAANGYPIRAIGQESPQQLIQAVCDTYCGDDKPFHSLFILFDEFGRYLEFATERPHIAGDAALQQIFEGVQDNAERCFLLCTIQYELKAYISRVSHEKRATISRYIGRYDSARKFYLSTNLETLFAHLIEKKDQDFLSHALAVSQHDTFWASVHASLCSWFAETQHYAVWREPTLFHQVIVQGCWPFHPAATWFLSRLSNQLQQRSAITFVADALEQHLDHVIDDGKVPWTISATSLCQGPLLQELLADEEQGMKGAVAQSYSIVEQKYHNDLSYEERHTLRAVLIATKLGLKVQAQHDADQALAMFAGLSIKQIEQAVQQLTKEYGVLEWNDRFFRYEIIGDAVPRSDFSKFLRRKTANIPVEQIEDLFAMHFKGWTGLEDVEPEFASAKNISTTKEWVFQITCSHGGRIQITLANALNDWKNAINTDAAKGQMIYYYLPADYSIDDVRRTLQTSLKKVCEEQSSTIPLCIILLHDKDGKLRQTLAEYSVLSGTLTSEERQKYTHFIEDHTLQLRDDLKRLHEEMLKQREYVVPKGFEIGNLRLRKLAYALFEQTYPNILPFPFDGFRTAQGNAAKYCREITATLFKGSLDSDWVSSSPPEIKNRVDEVIQKSWGAFDEQGHIASRPNHSGLRTILSDIEAQLKQEGSFLLGDVMLRLIAPPYGLNIASAGLVLGIFMSVHKSHAVFIFQGEELSPADWIGKAFLRNFLDISKLKQTEIRYVSEGEMEEWYKLLEDWMYESTHVGRVACMQEAEKLKLRIPPTEALYERWKRFQQETKQSLQILRQYQGFLGKEEDNFLHAYDKQDARGLSRVGNDLVQQKTNMLREEERWTSEEMKPIIELIDKCRQATIQFFDPWLAQQSCLSAQQVSKFNNDMLRLTGGNLKALGLQEQYKQLEKHVNKIISTIEEREKVKHIVEEANAFVNSRRISSQIKVMELREWDKTCDDITKTLRKAKQVSDVPEIDQVMTRIANFKNSTKAQIKQHEGQAGELWDKTFSSLEDVRVTQTEVANLIGIFSDDEKNMPDLQLMYQQLSQFERDIIHWNDLDIPTHELEKRMSQRIEERESNLLEDEEPPWDIREVYEQVLQNLLSERQALAEEWVAGVLTSQEHIVKMSVQECQSLIQRTKLLPAYLSENQQNQVNLMRKQLEERLDEFQVEGLLARFYQLSAVLQKKFLEKIADLMEEERVI